MDLGSHPKLINIMKNEFLNIIYVGSGGFLGSIARYGIARLFQNYSLVFFPYSTLSANIIGSFILGFLINIILSTALINPRISLFLTVGFCGGFTTFSTFSYENFTMIRDGEFVQAIIYILFSIILGLLAMYVGFVLSKYIIAR